MNADRIARNKFKKSTVDHVISFRVKKLGQFSRWNSKLSIDARPNTNFRVNDMGNNEVFIRRTAQMSTN